MLACARVGAIHCVVFAGFSSEALAERMIDGNCSLLVTTDGTYRGTKYIPLREIAEQALAICEARKHRIASYIVSKNNVKNCNLVVRDVNDNIRSRICAAQDFSWNQLMAEAKDQCAVEWVDAEDVLFILYTRYGAFSPFPIASFPDLRKAFTFTTSAFYL